MLVIFLTDGNVFALDVSPLLIKGHPQTPSSSVDFLFMQYRTLLREHPNSQYRDDAIFANGEYYYLSSTYDEAQKFFQQYLSEGKDLKRKLFAQGYLLRIAQMQNNVELIQKLAKEIRTYKQHIFIFSHSKEYFLNSPLKRRHSVIYSINQIEFYVGQDLLAKVSF